MTRASRHPIWFVFLVAAPIGCVDPNGSNGPPELNVAENKQKYVPQQGRLLEGFTTPDARRFDIPGASVANTELTIGGLTGEDVVNAPPFTATYGGATIDMRIAKVYPPDQEEPRWQYLLEQRNSAGEWEPACDAPPQLVPPNQPLPTPTPALAMPGEWLTHFYSPLSTRVTFACRTGVAAKCDGWGYSATSQWPLQTKNGVPTQANGGNMIQACTQMARADYCGAGVPNTIDGTPIWINDAFTEDQTVDGFAFEAAWRGRAAIEGRPRGQSPVVCLSKLRWSTLPLGGDCPLQVPDPRVNRKAQFCDDLTPKQMEFAGALMYSASTYIDAGLYTYIDPVSQLHLTTANLLPTTEGFAPEWQIPAPANVPFPALNEDVALEATIFRATLPVQIPDITLAPLSSYQCANDLLTSTTAPTDPTCSTIAMEGWVYPPGTAGRAPLRRWYHPVMQHSYTTAKSPSTMLAGGWKLAEVVGGVIRAAIDVNVRWSWLPGYSYTLDVQTRTGDWITSCIDSTQIGMFPWFVYSGVCTGAGNRSVNHADIAAFRVTYTRLGFPTYVATGNYDGFSSDAYVALSAFNSWTTALALHWNDIGNGAKYAVDVRTLGGNWIRCADENALGSEPAYLHTGRCWSAGGMTVPISNIKRIRVCAIDPQSGQDTVCSTPRSYNGHSPRVALRINP